MPALDLLAVLPAGVATDTIQLTQLGQLDEQGLLTDEEFARQGSEPLAG